MILEQAFPGFLLTVPEIAALVGNQIYGVMRPQGERPLPEILIARLGGRSVSASALNHVTHNVTK